MKRLLPMALALASCSVGLETPDGISVRCVDDGDCRTGHCSAYIAKCIPADDDDAPPTVTSAESLDERHVTIVFSRRMDATAIANFSVYSLSAGLAPLAVVAADDALSVVLETSLQKQRTYLLDIVDLRDADGRPLARSPVPFQGTGEPTSTRTPTPLVPIDHALAFDPTTDFTWTALPDATFYELTVATDAAFSQQVEGSPFVTQDTQLSVVLPENATYFWRVTADTSAEEPLISSFVVFGDAIVVHCPAGEQCDAPPAWDDGTVAHPMRSITRALSLASYGERSEVHIATRGGGDAYNERLIVSAPVQALRGGYDTTFAGADGAANPTVVRGEPTAIRLISNLPLEVSDLDVEGKFNAAILLDGVDRVTLRRVRASGSAGARAFDAKLCSSKQHVQVVESELIAIGPSVDAAGTRSRSLGCAIELRGSSVSGAGIDLVLGADLRVVENSRIEIARGTVLGDETYPGSTAVAVDVRGDSSLTLDHAFVRVGLDGEYTRNMAVRVTTGTVRVEASTIAAARPAERECDQGEDCQGRSIALDLGGVDGFGIVDVVVSNSVLVTNNPFIGASDQYAAAIDWHGHGKVFVTGSVLYTRDGRGLSANVIRPEDDIQLVNSGIVCDGSGTGLDVAVDLPRLLRAVVVAGCSRPMRVNGATLADGSAIEGLADGSHTFANVMVPSGTLVRAFPAYAGADTVPGTRDDDWACSAEFAASGVDTRNAICGGNGSATCPLVVEVDARGRQRTVPLSIGPIEVD